MSKDEKFEVGDIVICNNPDGFLYLMKLVVVGFKDLSSYILLHDLDGGDKGCTHQDNLDLYISARTLTESISAGYACGGYTSEANTWVDKINKEFAQVNSKHITEDKLKAAEQSVNQCNKIIKENKMATEKLTIEVDVKQLGLIAKTKKEKTPKIVCKVDGELMEFKNEEALKAFMWTSRCNEVIRYDLTGKVSVPFELTTTEVK